MSVKGDAMTDCKQNTDREIWREREGDYYSDSIHVTEGGGIGIDCGGMVFVKPAREWHRLAASDTPGQTCTCGSNDPASARFKHSHLAWCDEHTVLATPIPHNSLAHEEPQAPAITPTTARTLLRVESPMTANRRAYLQRVAGRWPWGVIADWDDIAWEASENPNTVITRLVMAGGELKRSLQQLEIITKKVQHCEHCGGDWYDGGLNAPECPWCRLATLTAQDAAIASELEDLQASYQREIRGRFSAEYRGAQAEARVQHLTDMLLKVADVTFDPEAGCFVFDGRHFDTIDAVLVAFRRQQQEGTPMTEPVDNIPALLEQADQWFKDYGGPGPEHRPRELIRDLAAALRRVSAENAKLKAREFTIADAWQDGWDRALDTMREIEKPSDDERDQAWVQFYQRQQEGLR